jgi:FkbM family methyltransferase
MLQRVTFLKIKSNFFRLMAICLRIKKLISNTFQKTLLLASETSLGTYFLDMALKVSYDTYKSVKHRSTKLNFCVPNNLTRFRVDTFSLKEPETLDWIDSIPEDAVLWDIGANIGLYSCYAAKSKGCMVYAFEPSVFNLELLARNVYINGLVDQVVIIPLPLSNLLKISTLNMTSTEWGGALSSFGETFGHDGMALNKIFSFTTIGLTLDQVVNTLKIPEPTHLKIDVDGLEHMILSGGEGLLNKISELAIEVNDKFSEQAVNVAVCCEKAGLVFRHKKHSAIYNDSKEFGDTYNQLWYRPK